MPAVALLIVQGYDWYALTMGKGGGMHDCLSREDRYQQYAEFDWSV
jgi:hypothetical protein